MLNNKKRVLLHTCCVNCAAASIEKLIESYDVGLYFCNSNIYPVEEFKIRCNDMQKYAESAGFSVVRDFVGHGIGKKMHEEPRVPNFVSDDLLANDIILAEGMILAVEPMINAGGYNVKTLRNGWTVVTRDGKCSAHFEHTIAITGNGCEVLTIKN